MEILRAKKAALTEEMTREAEAAFDKQDTNRDNVLSFSEGLTPETVGGVRRSPNSLAADSRNYAVLDALGPEVRPGQNSALCVLILQL